MSRPMLWFALWACGLSISSMCEADGVAAPEYFVGDSWEYAVSVPGSDQQSRWIVRLLGMRSNGTIDGEVSNGKDSPEHRAMTTWLNMTTLDESKSNPRPRYPLVKYPLEVGMEWSFGREIPDELAQERGSAKVLARESITVPAGTFDCFRIEATATTSWKVGTARRDWTRWYCPEVRWFAKEDFRVTGFNPFNGGGFDRPRVSELVKYSHGEKPIAR